MPTSDVQDTALFLLVGSLSAAMFGIGKVGFGSGVGALSFPLMVIACGNAFLAAGIMLPLLIVADGVGIATWWRQWKWTSIALLLPGIVIGTAVGAGVLWYLRSLDRRSSETPGAAVLQMVIGLIALTFVVLERLRRRTGKAYTFRPVLWQATLAGALLSISSTLAHSGGPIAMMYLLSQRLSKERFVANTIVLFCIVNQSKLVAYIAMGMIDVHSLTLGAYLVPAVVGGAIAGRLLIRRVGNRSFAGIIHSLLAVAGIHLLYKAATTLWAW